MKEFDSKASLLISNTLAGDAKAHRQFVKLIYDEAGRRLRRYRVSPDGLHEVVLRINTAVFHREQSARPYNPDKGSFGAFFNFMLKMQVLEEIGIIWPYVARMNGSRNPEYRRRALAIALSSAPSVLSGDQIEPGVVADLIAAARRANARRDNRRNNDNFAEPILAPESAMDELSCENTADRLTESQSEGNFALREAGLSNNEWAVFRLHTIDELSHAEAAETLGISEGAARTSLYRACLKLKRYREAA